MKKSIILNVLLLILGIVQCVAQAPEFTLLKRYGGSGNSTGSSLALESTGNSIIGGLFTGTFVAGNYTFQAQPSTTLGIILKLDTAGACLWAKEMGSEVQQVVNDGNDNYYVSGRFIDSLKTGCDTLYDNDYNGFLAKLDAAGNCIWLKPFYGDIRAIHVVGDYLFLTGNYDDSLQFDTVLLPPNNQNNGFIMKLNSDGACLFAKSIVGSADAQITGKDIKTDSQGNILVGGDYSDTLIVLGNSYPNLGIRNLFVIKMDTMGNYLWCNAYGGDYVDDCIGLVLDSMDNYYIFGTYRSTSIQFGTTVVNNQSTNYDIYLAKFDPSGNSIWAKSFGGTGNDYAYDFVSDGNGGVYITGQFSTNNTIFYVDTATITFGFNGPKMFVININGAGSFQWAKTSKPGASGSGVHTSQSMQMDAGENIYVTGEFTTQMNVGGPDSLVSAGGSDIFLTRLGNNFSFNYSNTSIIKGKIFHDLTSNCNLDSGEALLSTYVVKANPGNYYAISNSEGEYQFLVPFDTLNNINYTIEATNYSNFTFQSAPVCPTNNLYNVNVGTSPDTLSGYDFAYYLSPCHLLEVEIGSNRRRRCFENSTIVKYKNSGSTVASSAYIMVEFPAHVVPLSSSLPWIYINDSTYRFDLGDVTPGYFQSILITDSVKCEGVNTLGNMQCTKATIFPATNCVSSNWNGAEIGASSACNNGIVEFQIYNQGMADMTDSVEYKIYYDSVLVNTNKTKLAVGDTLHLQANAGNTSVRLRVEQVNYHPSELFVISNMDGCGLDSSITPISFINHFLQSQQPDSKVHCMEITGSYDPNDKQVFPIGFTSSHIVEPNTKVEYMIRFQNTGSDTAFTVVVIDTLSLNLEPGSFEMGVASHSYQLSMQTNTNGKTALKWTFNNINLPDSTTDLLGSQGFLQFRIRPTVGLPLGSVANNHAEIYFDFNPPIITNQTITTFDNITFSDSTLDGSVQIVGVITNINNDFKLKHGGVSIYPNPLTNKELTITSEQKGILVIYNSFGQVALKSSITEGIYILPVNLPAGIYFAIIETVTGKSSFKIIIQ